MINFKNLTDRQFRACLGYSFDEFQCLLKDFEATYFEKHHMTYAEYIIENVTATPQFKTLEDCLHLVLFQIKNDLIWDSLSAVFNKPTTTVRDNFKQFSKLLEEALEKKSNASS